MLAKKFFNSQKVFVNVPAVGSGYFTSKDTGNFLSIYSMASDTFSLSIHSSISVTGVDDTSQGNSAGNGLKGIFVRTGSGTSAQHTVKLTYATQAFVAGGDLTAVTSNNAGWGHGNTTKALFKVGPGLTTVNTYDYASDTGSVAASAQSVTALSSAAVGNDTELYVTLPVGSNPVTTERWTYASETHVAGQNMNWGVGGGNSEGGNSVGNASQGIFVFPSTSNAPTCLYNYGAQTCVTSTVFAPGPASNNGQGTSDGTAGLMLMGNTSINTRLWTFAGSTVVNGGSLSQPQFQGCAGISSGNPGCNI